MSKTKTVLLRPYNKPRILWPHQNISIVTMTFAYVARYNKTCMLRNPGFIPGLLLTGLSGEMSAPLKSPYRYS